MKANFRQQKRQRELARKERQAQRLIRRGEQAAETPPAAPVSDAPVVDAAVADATVADATTTPESGN